MSEGRKRQSMREVTVHGIGERLRSLDGHSQPQVQVVESDEEEETVVVNICMELWNNVYVSDNVATTFLINFEPIVSPSDMVTTEHDRCVYVYNKQTCMYMQMNFSDRLGFFVTIFLMYELQMMPSEDILYMTFAKRNIDYFFCHF